MMFHLPVSYIVAILDLSGGRGLENPKGRGGGLHPLSAIISGSRIYVIIKTLTPFLTGKQTAYWKIP